MDKIQIGDVVVLLDDDTSNCVADFRRYIGLAGKVMKSYSDDRIRVQFADNDYTWYYDPDQLEVIGSVRNL